jgi:hypothetical protein
MISLSGIFEKNPLSGQNRVNWGGGGGGGAPNFFFICKNFFLLLVSPRKIS